MYSGYILKTYYSFEEVLESFLDEQRKHEWENLDWHSFFYSHYPSAPIYDGNFLKDYLNDLMELVFARFKEHYACAKVGDEVITTADEKKIALRLINIIVNTYPKYSQLMKYYSDLENQLMKKISSSTVSVGRFNDTPQNEGDFADDEHTSNITKSETSVGIDGDSPINRLSEIKSKLSSILYDWSNEFDKLFIEEGNI